MTETLQKKGVNALKQVYLVTFPKVAKFVADHGGSLEEARDLFHDALMAYWEKQQDPDFSANAEAYVVGISKNLWFKRCRNQKVAVDAEMLSETAAVLDEKPEESKVLDMLEQAGTKCLLLLKAFYYDRLSMNRIATAFGYKTERSATVQKYKCLEKVRNHVRSLKISYEDFLA